jgi:hypothetical protein
VIKQKKIEKITLCLLSVAIVFLNLGTKTYAQDLIETTIYETRQGISLYRHHMDVGQYCVLVRDIILTKEEAEELLGSPDKVAIILKKTNFLLRRKPSLRNIKNDNIIVDTSKVHSDQGSYELGFKSTQGSQLIQIKSQIHVVEEVAIEFTQVPTPPTRPVSTPRPTVTASPSPTAIMIPIPSTPEPIIENEIPTLIIRPETPPKMQTEVPITEQAQEQSIVEPLEVIEAEEFLEADGEDGQEQELQEENVEEVKLVEEEEVKSIKVDSNILAHSYLATFSLSGILLTLFGISIFLDIKTILWYRRKRKENRDKRCRR